MRKFKVAINWEMMGEIEIEADSIEEAVKKAEENINNIDISKGEYIDSSLEISKDMELQKAINSEIHILIDIEKGETKEISKDELMKRKEENLIYIKGNRLPELRPVGVIDKDIKRFDSASYYLFITDLSDETIKDIIRTLSEEVDCYNFDMLIEIIKGLGGKHLKVDTVFGY